MATEPEHSELARTIGHEIRRLRTDEGLTQHELAERSGVLQQNLSLYERGLAVPRLDTLERNLDSLDAEVVIRRRRTAGAQPGTGSAVSIEEVRDLVRRLVGSPVRDS
jgi:transcriptional regulator with XRE-family HTH domain